jgi:ATP-binding cassette subfamily B protein
MTALAPPANTPVAGTSRITARTAWALLRVDPLAFFYAWSQWILFHSFPLAIGLVYKLVLDRATDASVVSPWGLLAALGGLEVARWGLLISAAVQWHGAFIGWMTVPRVNLLRSLACGPGATSHQLPGSPGEAVSRFRDDTQDLALVLDVWLDISGAAISAAIAVAVMFTVAPVVTVVAAIPTLLALFICRILGTRLRTWRRDAREATARVTAFVGDAFGAVLAIKSAGAEDAVRRRFAEINANRAAAARRDLIGTGLVRSLSTATGGIGIGIALLLAAPAVRSGTFTVGDIGLFTSFLVVLGSLPLWAGRLGAYHRQAEVSIERLTELHHERVPSAVVAPVATYLRHGPSPLAPVLRQAAMPLAELRVEGLRPALPALGGSNGAGHTVATTAPVDLVVRAGELIAITGPVGSGKSTLLRALLGLVPCHEGTIRWNGTVVDDPSTWFVPPRASYVPQVPRLFSESLAATILLGLPDDQLGDAIRLACLDGDVAGMPDGLATVVGARGVRLSGGQSQRAGAARALVRQPELFVVDDLSSALDVETEARLWDGLLGTSGPGSGRQPRNTAVRTALVVTHRPRLLERADRVIVLGSAADRAAI